MATVIFQLTNRIQFLRQTSIKIDNDFGKRSLSYDLPHGGVQSSFDKVIIYGSESGDYDDDDCTVYNFAEPVVIIMLDKKFAMVGRVVAELDRNVDKLEWFNYLTQNFLSVKISDVKLRNWGDIDKPVFDSPVLMCNVNLTPLNDLVDYLCLRCGAQVTQRKDW